MKLYIINSLNIFLTKDKDPVNNKAYRFLSPHAHLGEITEVHYALAYIISKDLYCFTDCSELIQLFRCAIQCHNMHCNSEE